MCVLPTDHLLPVPIVLTFHLCSASKSDNVHRSCANVRVIPNHRLQKAHWHWVKKRVELDAVLRLDWRSALRHELLTQAVLYVTHECPAAAAVGGRPGCHRLGPRSVPAAVCAVDHAAGLR